MMGIAEVAAAAVATLSPYLPSLLKAGEFVGEKLVDGVATKAADKGLEKAGEVWDAIKGYFAEKPDLKAAAALLATKPGDATYQEVLAKLLASLLNEKPDLSKSLIELIGGNQRVQEISAEHASLVEGVTQELEVAGKQSAVAKDNSVIRNSRQTAK
jgi:hypothetical protein